MSLNQNHNLDLKRCANMKTLVYESPITSLSGYGEHSREIAEYILKLNEDYDLFFVDSPWGTTQSSYNSCNSRIKLALKNQPNSEAEIDIFIQVGLLHELKCAGQFNIGISAVVEVSLCSKLSIVKCNLMDIIVVPSEFCKSVIENSAIKYGVKLNTPIKVIPQCVRYETSDNSETSNESITKHINEVEEDFCFLSAGEWNLNANPTKDRKNIEYLIRTFISTFKNSDNKPALVLKVHNTNYSETDYGSVYTKIKNILEEYDTPPNIYLLHGNLTKKQIIELYDHDKIKCHIYTSRGEGFGRSILESTLTGKPTFAPHWSGQLDYIKNQEFLISGELTYANCNDGIFPEESKWFEISTRDLSDKLKDVVLHYDSYCIKMVDIQTENSKKYEFSQIYKKYKELINSYISL
jgi:hypothetical protein